MAPGLGKVKNHDLKCAYLKKDDQKCFDILQRTVEFRPEHITTKKSRIDGFAENFDS